ncbi:hypothetical protein GGR54DRAFT_640362 [Hypoxylon sp. NC1633]|nr:hypothetical protein GGR54DRAFT_640362 [Hypoxylon sp. NC1633]
MARVSRASSSSRGPLRSIVQGARRLRDAWRGRRARSRPRQSPTRRRSPNGTGRSPPPRYTSPARLQVSARDLRTRIHMMLDLNRPVSDRDILRLADLEGVRLEVPGRSRRRLNHQCVARIGKKGDFWYFLGYNGFFLQSPHRHGDDSEMDTIMDTFVPQSILHKAFPYRGLCRRLAIVR